MTFDPQLIEDIKFDEKGLVPAIAQDYETGEVLMFAWMNKESLSKTIETNFAHYFSRSRKGLWKKGETSGHVQEVKEILIDCDNDCLILKIKQTGVACHTGARTCFFRKLLPILVLCFALISQNLYAQNGNGKVGRLNILSENALHYSLVKISRLYSSEQKVIVSVNFDDYGALLKDIEAGEPADIFIFSQPALIDILKQKGLVDVYQTANIGKDYLVLIASKDIQKLNIDEVKDADLKSILKIIDKKRIPLVLDFEETALGKYSDKALGNFKNNKNIFRKIPEDLKSIADIVGANHDFCGIVFLSSVKNRDDVKIVKRIEDSEIYYQAFVVAGENMDKARDFLKFIKNNEAQEILIKGGLVVD